MVAGQGLRSRPVSSNLQVTSHSPANPRRIRAYQEQQA
jgi:hypothetical protein